MMGPLEMLYYAGYRIDRVIESSRRRGLPRPVISIGNITTGGTGKTPATVAFAKEALDRGFRPCVLTRGYGGALRGPVLVRPEMSESDAGDEPLLMAAKLGQTPVVKCHDRFEGGAFALEKLSPDLFILDDGFQHWRLDRDVDVVLIDSTNPFGGGGLLPRGRLREPLGALARADVIIVTRCETPPPEVLEVIKKHNPEAEVFAASHRPTGLVGLEANMLPLERLSGMNVFAFAGIARPSGFFDMLSALGARIKGSRGFSDHYRYGSMDAAALASEAEASGADWIIATEKDIMRLRGLETAFKGRLLALAIEFSPSHGLYDMVFGKIAGALRREDAQVHQRKNHAQD